MTTATFPSVPSRYERDEDLAAGLASLATDAWRQLFDEAYDAVYHYAQLRTASDIAAGEIASSVCAQAVGVAHQFPSSRGGSMSRLLDLTDSAVARSVKVRPPGSRHNGSSHDALREAIGRLKANERNVVLLRLIEGRATDDTARMLRSAPGKVRSQQMRALQQLSREHGGFAHDGASGLDATLDGCIDRIVRGDPLEEVLSAQHGRTLQMLPLLRVAYGAVRLPRDPASDDARSSALAGMLRTVEVARFQNARQQQRKREESIKDPAPAAQIPRLHMPAVHLRPPARVGSGVRRGRRALAGIGAIGVASGVAAALFVITGGIHGTLGPSRLPSSVLMKGTPLAQDAGAIWITRGSELQRVETTQDTVVLRGDARSTLDGLNRGSKLEVIGTEQLDGTLRAAMVRIRDDQAAPTAAAQ